MYRKEDYLGSLRLETVKHALVDSEKKVIGDFIELLLESRYNGLRGVEYMVLPAGDFADFLNMHRGKPERIDLRVVADALSGSTMQKLFVERLEDFVNNYLNGADLPYTQRSGTRWHSARLSHDEESAGLIKIPSDGFHNICFELDADPTSRRRTVGIVTNNFGDRSLDDHLKYEKIYRQRSPMIFFDSKSPRKRIVFQKTSF